MTSPGEALARRPGLYALAVGWALLLGGLFAALTGTKEF